MQDRSAITDNPAIFFIDESNGIQMRGGVEAAGRFMWAMAGNLPGFEEASRALYAGDLPRLRRLIRPWPADIRAQVVRMLRPR